MLAMNLAKLFASLVSQKTKKMTNLWPKIKVWFWLNDLMVAHLKLKRSNEDVLLNNRLQIISQGLGL